MKKIFVIVIIFCCGTLSFYSCKSGHSGGCDAYGGSSSIQVKHLGRSL